MTCTVEPSKGASRVSLFLWSTIAALAVAACSTAAHAPPPATEVLVPVVKPCAVAQVDNSELPSASRKATGDIFEDVKTVLADRSVLKADREKLQAANSNPCP